MNQQDKAALRAKVSAVAAAVQEVLQAVDAIPVEPNEPNIPPPPPPPVGNGDFLLSEPQPLDLSRVVMPDFMGGGRYRRNLKEFTITGDILRLKIKCNDYNAGGVLRALAGVRYSLYLSTNLDQGEFIGEVLVDGTQKSVELVTPIPAHIPDGPVVATLVPAVRTIETFPRFIMTLDRKGEAKNARYVGLQRMDYEWVKITHGWHQIALVDQKFKGSPALPIPYVPAEPFNEALKPADWIIDYKAVPQSGKAPRRWAKTKRGFYTTAGFDSYQYADVSAAHRRISQPLLNGRRGEGSCNMPLSAYIGREGKEFIMEPQRFITIQKDGTVETSGGLYLEEGMYYEDAAHADCKIAGVWWDAVNNAPVPEKEQYFLRSWGGPVFLPWTTVTDPSLPKIDGEDPHPGDVVCVITDNHRGGRLIEGRRRLRTEPWRFTVVRYLNDPWGVDVDPVRREIGIAERGAHRILLVNERYEDVEVFQQGTPMGAVDVETVWRGPALNVTRAFPTIAPEGLCHYKGKWFWSSLAQAEIRAQVRDKSQPIEIVRRIDVGNNSNYVVIAMARDDSFGPVGSVFYTTWGLANNGWPVAVCPSPGKDADGAYESVKDEAGTLLGYNAIGPGGERVPYLFAPKANKTAQANTLKACRQHFGTPITHAKRWEYEPDIDLSYPSAVAVGYGRMLCGTAQHGALILRKRTPQDPQPIQQTAAWKRGRDYYNHHFSLLYGDGGNGWTTLPLPFGVDPDCDEYMRTFERVRWAV